MEGEREQIRAQQVQPQPQMVEVPLPPKDAPIEPAPTVAAAPLQPQSSSAAA